MRHEPKAYLFDIQQACEEILSFTRNMQFEEYASDTLVKAAVERMFMTIGEALARLQREESELLDMIQDWHKIVGFRNVLAHGYDVVDDATVWSAVTTHVPRLQADVEKALDA